MGILRNLAELLFPPRVALQECTRKEGHEWYLWTIPRYQSAMYEKPVMYRCSHCGVERESYNLEASEL